MSKLSAVVKSKKHPVSPTAEFGDNNKNTKIFQNNTNMRDKESG